MDNILNSIHNKNFVFWEEIARDGAQAKTILSAKQRIEIAKKHSEIFNGNAQDHLVFAAGFISISKHEQKIIEQMAEEVSECTLAVNCRSSRNEIQQSINSIKNAKYPRVAFVFPGSENLSRVMIHKNLKEALYEAVEITKFAKDTAGNIPVDIQLAGSFDSEPEIIAEISAAVKENGISMCHLGDTRGKIYPHELKKYLKKLIKQSPKELKYGIHLHNDLGFALANNLEAIKQGIMLASTSWLGLAERNGLLATELLTFILSYEPHLLKKKLGIDGEKLFNKENNLKLLIPLAETVAKHTGFTPGITHPIVGTGVNSISTGTPFVNPESFQPFAPESVLGIKKTVKVTQLASKRVIYEAAQNLGFDISDDKLAQILEHVKNITYTENRAIISDDELKNIFKQY